MWFALGLVTLAGAAVASGYRRLHAGELTESKTWFRYQIDRDSKTQALKRLRVSVPAPPKVSFECKRESRFDAFCKRWGLVRELQSGDLRFDRAVYVLTDDQVFRNALAGSLAKPLGDLFEGPGNYELQRLVCRDDRLVADFKPYSEDNDTNARHFAERIATALKQVSQTIPQAMGTRRFFDPLFFRSVLILGASTGLAITGALQWVRLMFPAGTWIYDSAKLWAFAFAGGGVLLLAMIVAAIAMLGRSARLHLVLVEVCLLGAFGAVSTSYAELRDAVVEFDSNAPVRVDTTIVDKRVRYGRKNRKTYYVIVEDWNRPGSTLKLKVSASDYNALPIGKASIVEHAGAMGIRWIDGLRAE